MLDAYSRRIVGWQLASNMRTSLVLDALRMALSRRHPGAAVELVHHSDAGAQYTSREFQQVLDDHQVLASIGCVGDAYDNALAESFVDTLKTELIADRVFPSRRALELAVVTWIGWYNHTRLHSSLGDHSPAEHEDRYYAAHAARRMNGGNLQTRTPRNPGRLLRCWIVVGGGSSGGVVVARSAATPVARRGRLRRVARSANALTALAQLRPLLRP